MGRFRRARTARPSPSTPTESHVAPSLCIEMRATLQLAIGIDNDDDINVTAILDQIQEHVRGKRNVTLDRVALEERKQEEGEPFDQFYIALREIANNADLCQHCIDDRLTTRIMSGIRDPETRRKLLTYTPPPSLQTTVDVCRSYEPARNDEATLANNDQGHTKIDKVGKKTRNTTTSKHNHRCGYCGKSAHKMRDECPARRSECSICKKNGSLGYVLPSKQNSVDHNESDSRAGHSGEKKTPPCSTHQGTSSP